MTKISDKFQFTPKYSDTVYVATRACDTAYNISISNDSLADFTMGEKELQRHVDLGFYKDIKDLSEPEMVFPFFARHRDSRHPGVLNFKVELAENPLYVKVTWCGGLKHEMFSVDVVKHYLKEGIWIVNSVGEKTEKQDDESIPVGPNVGYNHKTDVLTLTNPTIIAPPKENTDKLTVKVDTTEALASVKSLTQALEDLAISMESVIALKKELFNE